MQKTHLVHVQIKEAVVVLEKSDGVEPHRPGRAQANIELVRARLGVEVRRRVDCESFGAVNPELERVRPEASSDMLL